MESSDASCFCQVKVNGYAVIDKPACSFLGGNQESDSKLQAVLSLLIFMVPMRYAVGTEIALLQAALRTYFNVLLYIYVVTKNAF